MIRAALTLAAVLSIALAGSVSAHHPIEGPCGYLTVQSSEGTRIVLTPGDLEFIAGPGEWPTTYQFPAPAGTYHVRFYHGDELDTEADATVEACPTRTPPVVVGRTPKPTPPATSTAGIDPQPAVGPVGLVLGFIGMLGLTALIEGRRRGR